MFKRTSLPRTAILTILGSIALVASAQPYKFGCHYFRNLPPQRPALTEAERDQIDETIARSDTFDILHYDIAIDVTDYAGQSIAASTTISFTPLMPGQGTIRFDLYQLTVDSVTDGTGPLSFSHDGQFLTVTLSSIALIGTTYDITVHYHGDPHRDPNWGGFYFASNTIYNLGIGLTTIPPNFGKVWYPCFDSFVERATYAYHVKSAGTFRAHCQGDFTGETALGGDTVIRSFALNQEIPTHISAIAVADYQDSSWVHAGAFGPVPVTLTAKAVNMNGLVARFADLGGAIDACEHWYGPHAYSRVGYALTTDGALEIPTNIAYPQFMASQPADQNRGLYSHELGHHWWGDVVTPRVHNDMWLKEGPAEYTSHLFEEWLYGRETFLDVVKDNHLFVLEQAHLSDGGFQALSPMPDAYIYGDHTYYKGASVMHNLRGYLGDTLFRTAMTGAQAALANSDITPQEFRDALEAAGGVDLDAFFDDQVFAPGFSVFVVNDMTATPSGGAWEVQLDLRQRLRGTTQFHHDVPLDLTLVGAGWERQDYLIAGDGEFSGTTLTCDHQPVMAIINGKGRLNQARMDHELVIRPGEGFPSLLPRTEFRLYADVLPDSALVRVEHIWAAPDQDNVGWGIEEISDTHSWIVDGLWPAGAQFSGRIFYHAGDPTQLDFGLYGATEAEAMLVYRATPQDPWELYPFFTLNAGNLLDGMGNFVIDALQQGEYAFARGNAVIGMNEDPAGNGSLALFPVPASNHLTLRGTGDGPLVCDIHGVDGRSLLRTTFTGAGRFEHVLDVATLTAGVYMLEVRSMSGGLIGAERIEVVE